MYPNKNIPRLLGATFLFVFIASILSNLLLTSATGTGSISEILVNIFENLALIRSSILIGLVTSIGIVVLAVLLYVVLHIHSEIIALVALGWWLAEAILLAVSKIGLFALIPFSQEFIGAGTPEPSYFQTLGGFLYYGVYQQADTIHNLFFCLGGILWYYLLFKSSYIPRLLSTWGLAPVFLVLVNVLLVLFEPDIGTIIFLGAPYIVWEASIGPWLIIKGINVSVSSIVITGNNIKSA